MRQALHHIRGTLCAGERLVQGLVAALRLITQFDRVSMAQEFSEHRALSR
jgi:hypothetical protein